MPIDRRLVLPLSVLGCLCLHSSLSADEFKIRGSLSNRYKFRTNGDAHDHDLETLLSIDLGEPLADRYSGSLQVGGIFDLDGRETVSPFSSVYDGFGQEQVERIYHAYVDASDVEPFRRVRAGRQFRHEFESLYFDGASLQWKEVNGIRLTTFGGIPVHLFETRIGSDPGDWLVGGALEYDPVPAVRLRVDYVHLKDAVSGFRANVGDQEDNLFGASLWWDVLPSLMLSSKLTSFSDQMRDLTFEGFFRELPHKLSARLRVYSLLDDYGVRVIDVDAFGFLGEYEPFVEVGLTVTKGFGEHFFLDGGGNWRVLTQEQVASAFNHGFQRYFLAGTTSHFPIKGMSLSLTTDYYRGEDNVLRDDIVGISFQADQELFKRRLKLTAGTAYYLYRFNLLTGNESDDVRTYYARVNAKLISALEGRVGYEFETNEMDHFHTVDARVTWRF